MQCSSCGADIAVKGLFPSAKVHCACGAEATVPRSNDHLHNDAGLTAGPFRTAAVPEPEPEPELENANARPRKAAVTGGAACPRCHTPLDSAEGPLGCRRCGGVFLDLGDLERLAASTPQDPFRLHAPDEREPASTTAFVACPFCRVIMERRMFGEHSGVTVDICTKHGTWFDGGELALAIARVPHAHAPKDVGKIPGLGFSGDISGDSDGRRSADAGARAFLEVAVSNASINELRAARRVARREAWFAADFVNDLLKLVRVS